MAKQVIKVGDLVRVPRCWSHYVPFGVVCKVLGVDMWSDGGGTVEVERLDGTSQYVQNVKLAKQAMKQRDAYRERR